MSFNMLSVSLRGSIIVIMAVQLVMPVRTVFAESANSGVTNYEIPISELKKVKKKTPSKRVASESKKKKKSEAKAEGSQPAESSALTKTTPVVPDNTAKIESINKTSPTTAEPLPESVSTQIHHSPYSFVVADKSTVIFAVINSKTDIQEVNYILHSAAQTKVKMVKVNGTRFTYTATLPRLPSDTPSLRYTIVAVDSLGMETRSKEFVTPLVSSPVVPSWQLESAGEAISAEQKDTKKPLEK